MMRVSLVCKVMHKLGWLCLEEGGEKVTMKPGSGIFLTAKGGKGGFDGQTYIATVL